jgi:hypothetical protein
MPPAFFGLSVDVCTDIDDTQFSKSIEHSFRSGGGQAMDGNTHTHTRIYGNIFALSIKCSDAAQQVEYNGVHLKAMRRIYCSYTTNRLHISITPMTTPV